MNSPVSDVWAHDALTRAVVARTEAELQLAELVARVDAAQQLANMGDYDWHVASDTNRWSDQLYRIYGYEPQSFNVSYEIFIAHVHPDDRDRVRAVHERAFATGEPYELVERIVRLDGTVRILSSSGQVVLGPTGAPERISGTCVDITDRVEAERSRERNESLAAALREAELRRRQALEINDTVIQGLTAAVLAMTGDDASAATHYLERTLRAARHMMNDWLEPLDGAALGPGDLVRAAPSTLGHREGAPEPASPAPAGPASRGLCRILIAEDNADVRELLRLQLQAMSTCEVIGEAADGEEAVRRAADLQPDVVVLDLSMPRMDGLQALPLIVESVPGVRVIVMSGFAGMQMAEMALAAGAACYVEKGLRMDLPAVIESILKPA